MKFCNGSRGEMVEERVASCILTFRVSLFIPAAAQLTNGLRL